MITDVLDSVSTTYCSITVTAGTKSAFYLMMITSIYLQKCTISNTNETMPISRISVTIIGESKYKCLNNTSLCLTVSIIPVTALHSNYNSTINTNSTNI